MSILLESHSFCRSPLTIPLSIAAFTLIQGVYAGRRPSTRSPISRSSEHKEKKGKGNVSYALFISRCLDITSDTSP